MTELSAQGWLFPEDGEEVARLAKEAGGPDVDGACETSAGAGQAGRAPASAGGRGRLPADPPEVSEVRGEAAASSGQRAGGKSRSRPRGAGRAGSGRSCLAPWEDEIPPPAAVAASESEAGPPQEPQAPLAKREDGPGAEGGEGHRTADAPGETSDAQQVLSVTELTARIKEVLELRFPCVWVAGEIGDLSRPQSGHCYLVLKDAQSQIAAVIWRSTASRLKFDLHDGLEVVCRGRIEVYGPRGKYQLVIDQIEPRGIGALELALRQLRERLEREGLFDKRLKRPLPRFVRQIAVVTSPSGAAIRDFLEVLRRRWAGADVLLVPVRVQGEGAAEEIAAALGLMNRLERPIDCVALIRGGGSLEDLWAFNEEVVVRAIRQSRIPVVSGVGHEIDVTLADLAADVRALTPSEAAERIVPSAEEMAARLGQLRQRMLAAVRNQLVASRRRVEMLSGRPVFRWPLARVQEWARRVDELESRSQRALRARLERARSQIEAQAGRLETLSPLAVLGRGYSLTQREDDGHIVRDPGDVRAGQRIVTRLARGQIASRVEP